MLAFFSLSFVNCLYKHQPSSIFTIDEEIIGRINIAIDFKIENQHQWWPIQDTQLIFWIVLGYLDQRFIKVQDLNLT
jgi:hypothetical protein